MQTKYMLYFRLYSNDHILLSVSVCPPPALLLILMPNTRPTMAHQGGSAHQVSCRGPNSGPAAGISPDQETVAPLGSPTPISQHTAHDMSHKLTVCCSLVMLLASHLDHFTSERMFPYVQELHAARLIRNPHSLKYENEIMQEWPSCKHIISIDRYSN
jgi:hypothetical protein